ncbi:MAG: carboxypeptidase regulatory-like domain-containing protein [Candidatus Cloacimonetes bacterium]|nr:carboxypeptidase regulatory-like domain-containing protein [Candidatus Cloacimonadota bacterium]MCF7813640.1 carboxypeptidase regulatory-like domain-containing protein [Candidatus Cloacimonadota bacterium]MCF7868319.1 carboxypeptidase regulatory-like domain-containing protein [Candidatus Cloacimonadota bacterium]MCF7883793.1 carboxypeptidase regulatory-like domain-containing protein [Candidatus Cloacimonadota bacterium]
MKRVYSVIIIICSFAFLAAQTNIPAGVLIDLDWTAAESPYIIDGEIELASGDQLVIDAGVDIQFSGYYKFYVYGRILANGVDGNSITFTALNTTEGWHGLRFYDTYTNGLDPSQFHYCNFEYGNATGSGSDYRGGVIYCYNSVPEFYNCNFNNNSATTGGAIYCNASNIEIYDSKIYDNVASGAGGGLYISYSDVIFENVEITDNVSQYDGGGINCYASDPTLNYVLIADNFTEWNGGGVSAFNGSNPEITNCSIAYNVANQSGSGLAALYNSNITILNSIVWGDATNNIYLEPTASLSATYSDLESATGQSYFGTGCIDEDPLFADPTNGDYSLTWANIPTPDETKSPCIDTGDPNSPLDPDGTNTDMGAFFFAQNGITGTITLDGGTGSVEDVLVTATLTTPPGTVYTTNPDADGNYMLSLVAGTYDLVATLTGYSSSGFDNLVVQNELVVINLTLSPPPPGEIVGQVEVEGIGNPENVEVSAGNLITNPYPVEDPFNPGTILYYEYILEITPGTYDVTAELPGYETQIQEDVVVESGLQTTGIDFYLPLVLNEGTITGTVTLFGGAGNVENVIITAGTVSVSPAADGTYSLDILNGTYDVSASLSGYSTMILSDIQVIAFQTTPNINFTLIDGWQPITGTQYVMTAYFTVTYDGEFMSKTGSNQLAAFGYDQATGLIEECRGLATWEGGNHVFWTNYWPLGGYWYITIVSDNDSGLDNIWFKFYNEETDTILDCNEEIIFDDCVIYPSGVDLTIDSPSYDMEFDLMDNWNWVSFNLEPADYLIDGLFDVLEVVPDILQVKSQTDFGQYDPIMIDWFGGLDSLNYYEGYKIYMLNSYNGYTFSGEKINPLTHRIQLQQFYNWISYLPQTELTLEEALESIGVVDDTMIKTQTQSAVYYGGWIGDLTTMQPGISYILYWPDEITPDDPLFLDYPPHVEETRENLIKLNPSNLANWQLMPGTDSNMILMSSIYLNGEELKDDQNYSVGIFDKDGLCHSIGTLQNDLWYFTIIGDEIENLRLKLYDNASNSTLFSEETITYQPNEITGNPRELFQINFQKQNITPSNSERFQVAQNHPNPFNPETLISYNLPQDGKVQLQIFNAKGQLVETLVNGQQSAGNHDIIWNAGDQSSGIYFYKLKWNGHEEIRKCLLMK